VQKKRAGTQGEAKSAYFIFGFEAARFVERHFSLSSSRAAGGASRLGGKKSRTRADVMHEV
jgi:hypothetical protein